jgi:hypothetical protein
MLSGKMIMTKMTIIIQTAKEINVRNKDMLGRVQYTQ